MFSLASQFKRKYLHTLASNWHMIHWRHLAWVSCLLVKCSVAIVCLYASDSDLTQIRLYFSLVFYCTRKCKLIVIIWNTLVNLLKKSSIRKQAELDRNWSLWHFDGISFPWKLQTISHSCQLHLFNLKTLDTKKQLPDNSRITSVYQNVYWSATSEAIVCGQFH